MELTLFRTTFTGKSTIGELHVGGRFECCTLEDKIQAVKVKGETAIPIGRYQVVVNQSPKFHVPMPLLLNTFPFEGIRIHWGNTADDTEGCILVGRRKSVDHIYESRLAYDALFPKLQKAAKRGETIWLTIKIGQGCPAR